MTNSKRMPVLFLGHGSPMLALEESPVIAEWQHLLADVAKPRSILCISAHWERDGLGLTSGKHPETIHDFYGFPSTLNHMQYPAPGNAALVQDIADLLAPLPVDLDPARGFDHGAWAPLCRLFPEASIPLVQLSLDTNGDAEYHYRIGRKLQSLRDQGVLVIASGNLVHNLRELDMQGIPAPWAKRFDQAIAKALEQRDLEALFHWEDLDPESRRNHPTAEHLFPLYVALGASREEDPLRFAATEIHYRSLSMRSVRWG